MPEEDEIVAAVDEIAEYTIDEVVWQATRRLGMGARELLDRLVNELKARRDSLD